MFRMPNLVMAMMLLQTKKYYDRNLDRRNSRSTFILVLYINILSWECYISSQRHRR